MSIGPGTRVGPYEIESAIGAGGMGEVYRARDTKLGRTVAIKVLPDALAVDPDRVARFEREAKVLASLNHAHIATIYGVEDATIAGHQVHALVMELVEGQTLADRIAQGPVPVDEALPIARQIAEALEAAHEQGIIHRDLKPANIKLRSDGTVKVLDFGLAKALDSDRVNVGTASISPTITSPALMTGVGTLLGTAAYMAPEQARGKVADKRADIWAFGCVLYEMLAGKRAFDGDDVAVVLASSIKSDPDWSALPTHTPPSVVATVKRCLHKDPKQRIHDAADVQLALEGAFAPVVASLEPKPQERPTRLWHRPLVIGSAALLVGIIGTGAVAWVLRPPPAQVTRLTIAHPGSETIGGGVIDVSTSPDGRQVAYLTTENGEGHLYVRSLDKLTALRLGNNLNVSNVFMSPDGQWVGLVDVATRSLKKIPVMGGPVITIATAPPNIGTIQGASWGADDTIIFGSVSSGLFRVPAAGGTPTQLTTPDAKKGEQAHRDPQVLTNGRAVVFTIFPSDNQAESAQIGALDLQTHQQKVVVQGGGTPHYISTGHLVYGVAGTLRAVRFDPNRLEVRGNPTPVLEGVVTKPSGAASFSVSADGTLVYIAGLSDTAKRTVVWVDRQGHEEPINVPIRAYAYAALSPDGTRIALDVREAANDIWIWDLQRQTLTRLTFDPGLNRGPVWAPDGRHLAFSAGGDGIENVYWQAPDGSAPAEALTHESTIANPQSFSPDGTRLVFLQPANPPYDLGVVTLQGQRRSELILHGPYSEANAAVSPDGRWLAYQSNESGRDEVYVRPFPDVNSGRWQVSVNGGTRPRWARSGRELFYFLAPGTLMAAPIQGGPTFAAGAPQQLFKGPYLSPQTGPPYDVSPDGKRFLMIKDARAPGDASPPPQLVVVQSWTTELTRLVPP